MFSCCGGLCFVLLLANVWGKEEKKEEKEEWREGGKEDERKREFWKIPKFPKSEIW